MLFSFVYWTALATTVAAAAFIEQAWRMIQMNGANHGQLRDYMFYGMRQFGDLVLLCRDSSATHGGSGLERCVRQGVLTHAYFAVNEQHVVFKP